MCARPCRHPHTNAHAARWLPPVGCPPVLGLLVATMVAFGAGLIGMPFLIRFLASKGIGQPIHEDVTQHAHKAGTPVMGGLMVAAGLALGFVAAALVTGGKVSRSAVLVVLVILAGAGVGAVDDFLKVRR